MCELRRCITDVIIESHTLCSSQLTFEIQSGIYGQPNSLVTNGHIAQVGGRLRAYPAVLQLLSNL